MVSNTDVAELCRQLMPPALAAVLASHRRRFAMMSSLLRRSACISSIRFVQRWLADEPAASCSSADMARARGAAAVLSRPKPRQEEVRLLQHRWQAAQRTAKHQHHYERCWLSPSAKPPTRQTSFNYNEHALPETYPSQK